MLSGLFRTECSVLLEHRRLVGVWIKEDRVRVPLKGCLDREAVDHAGVAVPRPDQFGKLGPE